MMVQKSWVLVGGVKSVRNDVGQLKVLMVLRVKIWSTGGSPVGDGCLVIIEDKTPAI